MAAHDHVMCARRAAYANWYSRGDCQKNWKSRIMRHEHSE